MGVETVPAAFGVIQEGSLLDTAPYHEDARPREECGVYAIYTNDGPAMGHIYDSLLALEHRGPSAAGFAYFDSREQTLVRHVGIGTVAEAIPDAQPDVYGRTMFDDSNSRVAIGHTRYNVAESNYAPQPFVVSEARIALAHNGNIQDIGSVAQKYGVYIEDAVSDSDVLARVVAARRKEHGNLDIALDEVLPQLDGAFSLTITDGERIIGVRDPWGFRPLVIGELPDKGGYVLASEEVALAPSGTSFVRNVQRGEIVTIDKDGITSRAIERVEPSLHCMYEPIYLARQTPAIIQARRLMGRYLAIDNPDAQGIVVGVPNSGLIAAEAFAHQNGLPYIEAIKRMRKERAFLLRGDARKALLHEKHELDLELLDGLQDEQINIVDDSFIKGETINSIMFKFHKAGFKRISVYSAAPRFEHACYAGLDTRNESLLIARNRTDREVAQLVGAHAVVFNRVERVHQAIKEAQVMPGEDSCRSCVTGEYPFVSPSFVQKTGALALLPMAL